jgi:molecular chaperone HscB
MIQALPADYFEVFGIERGLDLDGESLQRKFYELSRQFHPDRFAGRPAEEQQCALDATAQLNDAWRTLRDPVKRAEYLLGLEGLGTDEARSKNVPPELLEEVFELNMMLEELREGDESTRPRLEEERVRFLEMLHGADRDLEGEFRRYGRERSISVLNDIRGLLNRRKYLQNLVRDVERALAES